jgi:hypothetical protein
MESRCVRLLIIIYSSFSDAQKIVAFVGITDITGLQNENGNAIESKYVHPLYMDTATHVSNYDIALIKVISHGHSQQ